MEKIPPGAIKIPPGADPDVPLQKQHPEVSWADRAKVMNFDPGSPAASRYFQGKGFEVKDRGNYEISLRRPGGFWYSLDPQGFDWSDITDIGGDIASGITMGVGAVLGAAATAPSGFGAIAGGAAGAATGGAAAHGVKQAAGAFLGFKPTAGEVLGGLGRESIVGAASELGARAIGAGIKGARGLLARGGAREIVPAPARDLPGAVNPVRPATQIPTTRHADEISRNIDSKIAEKLSAREGVALTEDKTIIDPLERVWAHQEAQAGEVAARGVEPPDYSMAIRGYEAMGSFPEREFTYPPEKFLANFIGKFGEGPWAETALRLKAEEVGIRNAWQIPTEQLKSTIAGMASSEAFRNQVVSQRKAIWDLLNRTEGKAAEATFVTNDGRLRHMFFSIVPPVTSKGYGQTEAASILKDAFDKGGLDAAKAEVEKLIGASVSGANKKKLAAAGSLEEIVDLAFERQKVVPGGKGFQPYDPRNIGSRTVWDIDSARGVRFEAGTPETTTKAGGVITSTAERAFKSLPLDKILRLRMVDPRTGKVAWDIDFLKDPHAIFMPGGGVGRTLERLGKALKKPNDALRRMGEAIPFGGVLRGGALGKAIVGTKALGDIGSGLEAIGKKVAKDQGGLIGKLLRGEPRTQKQGLLLLDILKKDGLTSYRAAAYAMASQYPAVAKTMGEE